MTLTVPRHLGFTKSVFFLKRESIISKDNAKKTTNKSLSKTQSHYLMLTSLKDKNIFSFLCGLLRILSVDVVLDPRVGDVLSDCCAPFSFSTY
jgi:hypothetical protein